MMSIRAIFFLIVITVCFQSCVGYSVQTFSAPANTFCFKSNQPYKGWKEMDIYAEIDSSEVYQSLAKILIVGKEGSSEMKLLNKMKREASRYQADAILHVETRQVTRSAANGLAAALNVVAIFVGDGEELGLDMGGDYYTLEVEGLAVKFKDE